jgi:DNA processing protein
MIDLAYVTLALVPGIGRARLDALLTRFETAEGVLAASEDDLCAVAGVGPAAATAIREASLERGARVIDRTKVMGGHVLVPEDARFPPRLREIPEPPMLLFALGRLELLDRPAVAIVGSRMHTRYGAEACRFFAGGAVKFGLVVVSGMARGLDAVGHRATLDAGGGTVGVLGNGLGVVYPSANKRLYEDVARDGCLITEFPPGERPNAGSFPRRNRMISGLAKVTLVVEARERSGTLITVDCALQQGREVLAVPGPITSPLSIGCNRLIQNGAKAALGLRDLLEEYGITEYQPAVSLVNDLTEPERNVLDAIALGLEHVDDIAAHLHWPVAEALAALTSLEIRGVIVQEPGKTFRRPGATPEGPTGAGTDTSLGVSRV